MSNSSTFGGNNCTLNWFNSSSSRGSQAPPQPPPPPSYTAQRTVAPPAPSDGSMSSWTSVLQQTVVVAASCYMMYKVYDTLDLSGRKEEKQIAQSKKQAFMAALREHFAHSPHVDLEKLAQQDFSTHECALMSHVTFPKDIDVTFDDIGGLDNAKEAMYEAITLPLDRPELFASPTAGSSRRVLQAPKGILFYGPPGTGKTMMAKAIAKSSGVTFINVNFSVLLDKYLGESQKMVQALFSLARKVAPSIIFVDEIDSFLVKRGSGSDNGNFNLLESQLTAQFMQLWDGITSDAEARVIVLAASNRPQDLDPAVLRRLPRTFKFGLPDAKTRETILWLMLRGEQLDESVALKEVAAKTANYSGSDLHEMCKVAAMKPIRALLRQERNARAQASGSAPKEQVLTDAEPRAICQQDFLDAIVEVPPTGVAANQYEFEEDDQKAAHMRERLQRQQKNEEAASAAAGQPQGHKDLLDTLRFMSSILNVQNTGNTGTGTAPAAAGGSSSDSKQSSRDDTDSVD